MPVVLETRPGVYRKNAWVAHIYGVRPNAARYQAGMAPEERDSFRNLLLLCKPHHDEVDDPRTGSKLYPPDTLRDWKRRREGSDGPLLETALASIDEDRLMNLLTTTFTPPLDRLEAITGRLEETGVASKQTVTELRSIVARLSDAPEGVSAQTARSLALAAESLGTDDFRTSTKRLSLAADVLPGLLRSLDRRLNRLDGYM
jgi:hypothetical protein